MTSTKSIIFDLGNVIVPFSLDRGYQAFARLLGLSPNTVAAHLQNSPIYSQYEAGQLSTTEFHASIQKLLQIDFELATLREAWNAIFHPQTSLSDELVLALKKRYRLVLLSNTNELHFEWLRERFPLLGHFSAFTLSHEVGAMKPDPKIFAAAIAHAQCRPEECFYTDDIANYVEAARTHGILAETFTDEAKLRTDLIRHGIAF
jgi:putative hydrolase of the HAD superfamily